MKYSEMSEQEFLDVIKQRINRKVRLTPVIYDIANFTPIKKILFEDSGTWIKSNVPLKIEFAMDTMALGGDVEKYYENFVESFVSDFLRITTQKKKVYLASGWFNPTQADELTKLEKIFDDRSSWIELASPRRIFICPPDAPKDIQTDVFSGNLEHIETASFLLVNTRDKDIGTIWEAGYGYAHKKPIIYFCNGLPAGAKFNLMLARSGIKVCTSFEQLEDYLDRCEKAGVLLEEPYDKDIE